MIHKSVVWLGVAATLAVVASASAQTPIGTAFTYQGQLKQGGTPLGGTADFQFTLWDAATNGNQVGAMVPVSNVSVADGLFTVTPDFGSDPFAASQARWLQVAVRSPGGSGQFTTLDTRQPLAPTPYSLATRGINVDASGNVGIGTANPGSRLHVNATTGGTAVQAESNGSGYRCAVDAFVESPQGNAIYAFNEGGTGNAYAMLGETASSSGTAIYGLASNSDSFDSSNIGVHGRSDGESDAVGVYGEATNTNPEGTTYGVRGVSAEGTGVRGENSYTGNYGTLGTSENGVYGRAVGDYDVGVRGAHLNTGNYGNLGTRDAGVYGIATGTTGEHYGVYGTAPYAGVYGEGAGGVFASYGLVGIAEQADTNSNYGVYARAKNAADYNFAGRFIGNVSIIGQLSKSSGSFEIDHPLDPQNKYLYHSFVESPDMMNIYNGNVLLDASGEAVVTLPDWFGALNMEFRYQLTCIGGFAPVYIAEEIADNQFKIAGGTPGLKVSWQVTGIRQDAFANANRIQVEVNKRPDERGLYLHPQAWGLSEELGIDYAQRQAVEVKTACQNPAREGGAGSNSARSSEQ